jgi:hypothetical protein
MLLAERRRKKGSRKRVLREENEGSRRNRSLALGTSPTLSCGENSEFFFNPWQCVPDL